MDETFVPRMTVDTHPVMRVLDSSIVDPKARSQEPAIKLANHVEQLLAGIGHLVNHSDRVVSNNLGALHRYLIFN